MTRERGGGGGGGGSTVALQLRAVFYITMALYLVTRTTHNNVCANKLFLGNFPRTSSAIHEAT